MDEECKTVALDCGEEMTYVKRQEYLEMKGQIEYLRGRIARMSGEIEAYRFCIRCNGVSGAEVTG